MITCEKEKLLEENKRLKNEIKDYEHNIKILNLIISKRAEELDDCNTEIVQLKKELNIFKMAFYTMWKSCNSNDTAVENSETYIEFRCGYETMFTPITEEEIDYLEKACALLDIKINEV
ncbi:MAG: hypothetical protein J6R47_06550 [Acholeplasmatales bacterium]|nr:hypothetical protein [Acholeplasmatales bacterium]